MGELHSRVLAALDEVTNKNQSQQSPEDNEGFFAVFVRALKSDMSRGSEFDRNAEEGTLVSYLKKSCEFISKIIRVSRHLILRLSLLWVNVYYYSNRRTWKTIIHSQRFSKTKDSQVFWQTDQLLLWIWGLFLERSGKFKLTQSTGMRQKCLDLRSLSPAVCDLRILLALFFVLAIVDFNTISSLLQAFPRFFPLIFPTYNF